MPLSARGGVVARPETLITILIGLIRTFRPRQGAKNALVLVPLFFTVNIWWETSDVGGMVTAAGHAFAALGIFVLLTAAVYIYNDVFDIEADRAHPKKRNRPIASGQLPLNVALPMAVVLVVGGTVWAFLLDVSVGWVALAYTGVNVAYSGYLKHQVILDVMAVATGFVLRALAGTLAIDPVIVERGGVTETLDLTISPWLYVVTALGALFLAFAKRRGELIEAGDNSGRQRSSLLEYNVPFLDQLIAIVATATLTAYTLYSFDTGFTSTSNVPKNNTMMLTIPFVAFGLVRYLYLMHMQGKGESPEEVFLSDWPTRINIVLWLATAATVLLVNR